MKKIIAVFIACVLAIISLSACSGGSKEADNTSANSNSQPASSESADIKKSKALVVYFSATGSTKKLPNI